MKYPHGHEEWKLIRKERQVGGNNWKRGQRGRDTSSGATKPDKVPSGTNAKKSKLKLSLNQRLEISLVTQKNMKPAEAEDIIKKSYNGAKALLKYRDRNLEVEK